MARYAYKISDSASENMNASAVNAANHPNGVFNENAFTKAIYQTIVQGLQEAEKAHRNLQNQLTNLHLELASENTHSFSATR